MAGEIYLSNITGNFDYAEMLNNIRMIKSQQILLLQQRESEIEAKKQAISDFGNILKDMQKLLDEVTTLSILDEKSVSVSDETAVDVTITNPSAVSPTNIDITVNQLAKNDVWLTGSGVSDKTAAISTLTSGTLSITYQGNTINVNYDNTDSLDSIVSKINTEAANNDLNIKASVFYDGTNYRLLIKGMDTGSSNTVTINDSGNLSTELGGFSNVQTAQDAQISIYGTTVTSETNTFNNVISGVSLTVKKQTTSAVNISVQNDYTSFKDKLKEFIGKYNEIVDFIKQNTGKNGTLSGEYSLQQIRSTVFNKLDPLMERGLLSVDKNTGRLSLNETDLDNLLQTNRSDIETMLSDLKTNLYDYFLYVTGTQGPVKLKEKSFDKQINSIEERIELMNKRIDIEIETLKKQFISLQMLMAQMQDVRSRLQQTFGAISQNLGGQ